MNKSTPQCRVRQCSKCPENSIFFCLQMFCCLDLCLQCKERHNTDLLTKDHQVVIYREISVFFKRTNYTNGKLLQNYCNICELPVINLCTNDETHGIIDIKEVYKAKRRQHRTLSSMLKSDVLFNRNILFLEIKTDYEVSQQTNSILNSNLMSRAVRLKCFIDKMSFCYNNLIVKKYYKRNVKINRYIVNIQWYEETFEQLAARPVQFLSFSHNRRFSKILDKPQFGKHQQVSITESINKKDVIKILSGVQIKEGIKRNVTNEHMLKVMSAPVLQHYFNVDGVYCGMHISFKSSNVVWVSDMNNANLTDALGNTLFQVKFTSIPQGLNIPIMLSGYGSHTVNGDNELIYVNMTKDIYKLSSDMKTTVRLISGKNDIWHPRCVFWSSLSGDLLTGMWKYEREKNTWTGKIARYNPSGELKQTIQHNSSGHELFKEPYFITENTNRDVVVSDLGHNAIIVTEFGGKHRYSYTGPPSGPRLTPRGVCTDVLSHILVSDFKTHTIHMVDKDGRFLTHLLTRSDDILEPWGLSYDAKTTFLCVGSGCDNILGIYSYITRRNVDM